MSFSNWWAERKERFIAGMRAKGLGKRGAVRYFVPKQPHATIVGGVNAPSKQHPCICGSGRKYQRCCKKAFTRARVARRIAELSGIGVEAVERTEERLYRLLRAWQAEQAKPKWQRAQR